MRAGVSFLELLRWHPKDVDTLCQIFKEIDERQVEADRDQRFAAMAAELKRRGVTSNGG